MAIHTIHFTLAEAQTALHYVRGIVAEIVKLKQSLDAKGFDVYRHQYFGGLGPNGQRFFPEELERLVTRLRELDKLGIQVKSLDQGLIDFPHIRKNGEEIYLCWLLGETAITHWHSIQNGFAGRRLLTEL
jgi:hypothetical protein